jgi:hypothetical protein
MSDVSGGPDGWQAADGKWYPPERHPDHLKAVPTSGTMLAQVQIKRRLRPWRLPCGHCSQKIPRFMALAPAVVTCPHCAGRTQVMEGALFRRGYAVS